MATQYVSANVAVHHVDARNGPMRLLPGTRRAFARALRERRRLPTVEEDPAMWCRSILQPVRPGDICLRDGRVLHGGTPNTADSTRYLPSVEFASKALRDTGRKDIWPPARVIWEDAFNGLPERAQQWCWNLVARGFQQKSLAKPFRGDARNDNSKSGRQRCMALVGFNSSLLFCPCVSSQ